MDQTDSSRKRCGVADRRRTGNDLTAPPTTRRRPLVALGLLLTLTVASQVGCSSMYAVMAPCQLEMNRGGYELRTRLRARQIWKTSRLTACYQNHPQSKDIRRGFIDGFVDVCMGGDGCPPPVAPGAQCCFTFGNPYEPCRNNAWLQGYPLGAAAAESCGCQKWVMHAPLRHQHQHVHSSNTPVGHHSACQCESCATAGLTPTAASSTAMVPAPILSEETHSASIVEPKEASQAIVVDAEEPTEKATITESEVSRKVSKPIVKEADDSLTADLQPSWAPTEKLSELIHTVQKAELNGGQSVATTQTLSDLIQVAPPSDNFSTTN